jgi:putative membrane protein
LVSLVIWRILKHAWLTAYALLWLGGIGVHCLGLATDEARLGAPAFLLAAAALVLAHAPGARAWLLAVGLAGFLVELLGSRTGFPFGSYSYTDALPPQLAGVPLVMSCAWVVLIGYVKSFEAAMSSPGWVRVAAGATAMVAIDLAIEPVAAGPLAFWRWSHPGPYYGVPLENFAGWFLISAAMLAAGRNQRIASGQVRTVGLSILAFFGLIGPCQGRWASPAVAAALAFLHFALSRRLRVAGSPSGRSAPAAKL